MEHLKFTCVLNSTVTLITKGLVAFIKNSKSCCAMRLIMFYRVHSLDANAVKRSTTTAVLAVFKFRFSARVVVM